MIEVCRDAACCCSRIARAEQQEDEHGDRVAVDVAVAGDGRRDARAIGHTDGECNRHVHR